LFLLFAAVVVGLVAAILMVPGGGGGFDSGILAAASVYEDATVVESDVVVGTPIVPLTDVRIALPQVGPVFEPASYAITLNPVRLRTGPDLQSESLEVLKKGTWLRICKCLSGPAVSVDKDEVWCQAALSSRVTGWVASSYLAKKTPEEYWKAMVASRRISPFVGRESEVDTTTLPRLLDEAGYKADEHFKAYVVEIERNEDGIIGYRRYDYKGTSIDRDDWWAASSVKLFAAVAALEYLRELRFGTKAEITYHYKEKDVKNSIAWLVNQALTPSNNIAFDRLVEIVGFENMKNWFQRRGLVDTILLRGYSGRVRDAESKLGTLRDSPAVTICEGRRPCKKLPQRHGHDRPWQCPNQGNCTTLQDLTEVLRRVMLHESLPQAERFNLGDSELRLIRGALSGKRSRGLGVVNGLREGFGNKHLDIYNKPGFAYNWFSDHVYVSCPECTGPVKEWLVAMAGWGGRDVLDEGAREIGRILASSRLSNKSEMKQ